MNRPNEFNEGPFTSPSMIAISIDHTTRTALARRKRKSSLYLWCWLAAVCAVFGIIGEVMRG